MKQILCPIETVKQLCGTQNEESKKEYRLSKHCIRITFDEGTLLYNTLTCELLFFNRGKSLTDYQMDLRKRWFYVPEDFNELQFADRIRSIVSQLKPQTKSINKFTILTTTDCNARCYYCYEKGCRHITMSEQTALDIAEYISSVSDHEHIKISWFGGEPLYNIRAIDIITDELKKRDLYFTSTMTSNGFYLTPDVVEKAADKWNLDSVQITIDGTEKIYNSTKAYIDECVNPFAKVLDNIKSALDAGIKVIIRLNVDSRNALDMLDAVDVLGIRFQGYNNCHIIVAILRSFSGNVFEFEGDDNAVKCYSDLIDKISSYGLTLSRGLGRELLSNRCKADNDSCEVILPDGMINKCEHFSYSEVIGSIYCPDRDKGMIDSWKERCTIDDMPECADCPLYPRCINLKKCDWTKNGCPGYVKKIRIRQLKKQLLKEYENYKKVNK